MTANKIINKKVFIDTAEEFFIENLDKINGR